MSRRLVPARATRAFVLKALVMSVRCRAPARRPLCAGQQAAAGDLAARPLCCRICNKFRYSRVVPWMRPPARGGLGGTRCRLGRGQRRARAGPQGRRPASRATASYVIGTRAGRAAADGGDDGAPADDDAGRGDAGRGHHGPRLPPAGQRAAEQRGPPGRRPRARRRRRRAGQGQGRPPHHVHLPWFARAVRAGPATAGSSRRPPVGRLGRRGHGADAAMCVDLFGDVLGEVGDIIDLATEYIADAGFGGRLACKRRGLASLADGHDGRAAVLRDVWPARSMPVPPSPQTATGSARATGSSCARGSCTRTRCSGSTL